MFSGISIWQLLILLAIVVVLFGTKKLRNMGSDLGGAVKGFKDAVKEGEEEKDSTPKQLNGDSTSTTQHAEKQAEKDKDNV